MDTGKKPTQLYLMFCNECSWKERTVGLKYAVCPKCGHINIGFTKVRGGKEQ